MMVEGEIVGAFLVSFLFLAGVVSFAYLEPRKFVIRVFLLSVGLFLMRTFRFGLGSEEHMTRDMFFEALGRMNRIEKIIFGSLAVSFPMGAILAADRSCTRINRAPYYILAYAIFIDPDSCWEWALYLFDNHLYWFGAVVLAIASCFAIPDSWELFAPLQEIYDNIDDSIRRTRQNENRVSAFQCLEARVGSSVASIIIKYEQDIVAIDNIGRTIQKCVNRKETFMVMGIMNGFLCRDREMTHFRWLPRAKSCPHLLDEAFRGVLLITEGDASGETFSDALVAYSRNYPFGMEALTRVIVFSRNAKWVRLAARMALFIGLERQMSFYFLYPNDEKADALHETTKVCRLVLRKFPDEINDHVWAMELIEVLETLHPRLSSELPWTELGQLKDLFLPFIQKARH